MNSTPVDYIARTREQYDALGYEPYRWAERPDAPPWTPLEKPVADSTVALVASGGAYRRGHVAFHWNDDTGIRMVRTDDGPVALWAGDAGYDAGDPAVPGNRHRLTMLGDRYVVERTGC